MPNFGHLYECECPYLNRKALPFRDEFEKNVIQHITTTYPPSEYEHLTYITHASGGLLADARIIHQLLESGYRALTIVGIEPLYEKNMAVLQACLDFTAWCSEQKKCSITIHWYKKPSDYAKACVLKTAPRGNVYLCIDPDDAKTQPNFGSPAFRKRFETWCSQVLYDQSSFYYLYFEPVNESPYRHQFIGTRSIDNNNKRLLQLHHAYGENSLQEKHGFYTFNISIKQDNRLTASNRSAE